MTSTLERCKALLGITEDSDYLEFCIELVETLIKGYCNITVVPESIQSLVIRKVINNYNRDGGSFAGKTGGPAGPLTSISRGNVSYGFASNSAEAKKGFMGAVTGEWTDEEKSVLDPLKVFPALVFTPSYSNTEEVTSLPVDIEEEP
jgi:hypothetical protein